VSTTLCALDALALRGYSVEAVVMLECEDGLSNADAVRQHLPPGTPLVALPALPAPADGALQGVAPDGSLPPHVLHWLRACEPQFAALAATLRRAHAQRVADLAAAPARARATLWWPFTQHDDVRDEDVTVIDARSGDELLVHDPQQARAHACVLCVRTR
jgi:dethiobiotin synthetase/adenosylmethionine--8-amino-7-oxononanoate aminotransferase